MPKRRRKRKLTPAQVAAGQARIDARSAESKAEQQKSNARWEKKIEYKQAGEEVRKARQLARDGEYNQSIYKPDGIYNKLIFTKDVLRMRWASAMEGSHCSECFTPLAPQASVTIIECQTVNPSKEYHPAGIWWPPGRLRRVPAPVCLLCWLKILRERAESERSESEYSFHDREKLLRLRCAGCKRPMRVLVNKRHSRRHKRTITLRQRTCCGACYEEAQRQRLNAIRRVQHEEIDCEVCGNAFVPTKSTALTCSNTCRQKKFRQQRAQAKASPT